MMGTSAKNQCVSNVKNTVGGFKALMGRSFSDPVVQLEKKRQHYQIDQLPGDKVGIKVSIVVFHVICFVA